MAQQTPAVSVISCRAVNTHSYITTGGLPSKAFLAFHEQLLSHFKQYFLSQVRLSKLTFSSGFRQWDLFRDHQGQAFTLPYACFFVLPNTTSASVHSREITAGKERPGRKSCQFLLGICPEILVRAVTDKGPWAFPRISLQIFFP